MDNQVLLVDTPTTPITLDQLKVQAPDKSLIPNDLDPNSIQNLLRQLQIPYVTTVPTSNPGYNAQKVYFDGSNYYLYIYANGGWRNAVLGGGVVCRAHQASGQSISDVTNTKINIDSADIAASGITFDTSNKRFTALTAGNYKVFGSLVFSDLTDQKLYGVKLYKNGGAVTTSFQYASLTGSNLSLTLEIHDIITLAVGDYIELWTFHNSGATEIASGGVLAISS